MGHGRLYSQLGSFFVPTSFQAPMTASKKGPLGLIHEMSAGIWIRIWPYLSVRIRTRASQVYTVQIPYPLSNNPIIFLSLFFYIHEDKYQAGFSRRQYE
jgi:hypothetical protein